jgi:hypothetical protein
MICWLSEALPRGKRCTYKNLFRLSDSLSCKAMHQDGVKFGETTIYGGIGLSAVERTLASGLSKEKMRAEGLFEKAYQGKMVPSSNVAV